MKHAIFFTPVLILWLRLSVSCAAQLQWESRELEFSPSVDQTQVIAHFKFQNVGQSEIKITSVSTSCGCTTAALEINIKILNDLPMHAVSAISSDPRILARIEETVPSKEYRVVVEPKGTNE